jgi:hypothetical protein
MVLRRSDGHNAQSWNQEQSWCVREKEKYRQRAQDSQRAKHWASAALALWAELAIADAASRVGVAAEALVAHEVF